MCVVNAELSAWAEWQFALYSFILLLMECYLVPLYTYPQEQKMRYTPDDPIFDILLCFYEFEYRALRDGTPSVCSYNVLLSVQ